MSGYGGSGIPDWVVAYAAGLFTALDGNDRVARIAGLIAAMGMGAHEPDRLLAAILMWIVDHVDGDAIAATLERRAASVVTRNAGGSSRCTAEVAGGRCAGLLGHEGEHYANARDRAGGSSEPGGER